VLNLAAAPLRVTPRAARREEFDVMILLGIILILLAALLGLGGLWLTTSGDHTRFTVSGPLGMSVEMSPAALLILGMVAMGLLWAGWWLIKYGTVRGLSRRRERKDLERERREQERALAETNAKLGRDRESAAEAERRREEERVREARLRVEADRRREAGREDEVRRLAADRDAAVRDPGQPGGPGSAGPGWTGPGGDSGAPPPRP